MYRITEIEDLDIEILNKKIECFKQFDKLSAEAKAYLESMLAESRFRNLNEILSEDEEHDLVLVSLEYQYGHSTNLKQNSAMKSITINTTKDVQDFCQFLYDEYDLAFHPDDPFDQYINAQGLDLFTKDEAEYLDSMMQRCFDVCEQANTNVYDVMEPIQKAEFRKRGIMI